jgi:O-antigen ligase
MSGFTAPRLTQSPHVPVAALAGALGLAIASAAGAVVLSNNPPSWLIVIGGGIGLSIVVALAVARYETAVALGILLFGVVRVEPAPPDAIFGIVMLVALVTGRFNVNRAPLSILALSAALLIVNIASMVDAVDPERAAFYLAITLYVVIFAIWFTGYLDSVRRARGVVLAYLTGAVSVSALASLSLFVSFPGSTLFSMDGERAEGLFKDPNVYGPFLIPIALILFEELLAPRLLRMRRVTKAAYLLILVLGLLFSYSRGAWINFTIAVVVMLGVMAVRRGGGRRALAMVAILALSGVAVGGALAATGSLGFLQERAKFQSYDNERFAAQRRGIHYGETHPLGIGPGQFEVLAPLPSHNLYIRSFSEQGVLGLVLVLALVGTTLLLALRNAVLGRDTYGIGSAALLGAWVGMCVESFVIDTLHWRHLFLVAALIWVAARRQTPNAGKGLAIRGGW